MDDGALILWYLVFMLNLFSAWGVGVVSGGAVEQRASDAGGSFVFSIMSPSCQQTTDTVPDMCCWLHCTYYLMRRTTTAHLSSYFSHSVWVFLKVQPTKSIRTLMAVNTHVESVMLHVLPDGFSLHLVAGERNGGNVWRHGVTEPLGRLCQT